MGQDFIEKRNERCVRLQEYHYEKRFKERDLFSDILPVEDLQLTGYIEKDDLVAVGDELWHNHGDMLFFKGAQEAVRLEGDPASTVQDLEEQHNATLVLRVLGVNEAAGVVQIAPIRPNRGD